MQQEFCEMPFVVTFDGKRVTGKIDRLCELTDGSWVVIDYKSEVVSSASEYGSLTEEYTLSISVYCEAVQQWVHAEVAGWCILRRRGVLASGSG